MSVCLGNVEVTFPRGLAKNDQRKNKLDNGFKSTGKHNHKKCHRLKQVEKLEIGDNQGQEPGNETNNTAKTRNQTKDLAWRGTETRQTKTAKAKKSENTKTKL